MDDRGHTAAQLAARHRMFERGRRETRIIDGREVEVTVYPPSRGFGQGVYADCLLEDRDLPEPPPFKVIAVAIAVEDEERDGWMLQRWRRSNADSGIVS